MKKLIVLACLASTVSMTAGVAMADSIKGKLGVTAKIGLMSPSDNNAESRDNKTDIGFVAGGGLIYGVDDHFAAEIELSRTAFGSDSGDFGVTNISFGGQYRFALSNQQFVPYVGAGMDILFSDYDPNNGTSRDIDTTVGAHASAGLDYFIQKKLVLTFEAKMLLAPDTSITDQNGVHRGDFDPSSFSSMVGIRYFFN